MSSNFSVSNNASLMISAVVKDSKQKMGDSSVRVASGKNVVTARDNPAGVATATRLGSNVAAFESANSNISSGKNALSTTDSILGQVSTLLMRLKTLSSSGVNGSFTSQEYEAINNESQALKSELDRLATSSSFNGKKLLDGSFNQKFAVGTNVTGALDTSTEDVINIDLSRFNISSNSLGLVSGLLSASSSGAASAEASAALDSVSLMRAEVGAMLSRFDYAEKANTAAINSLQAAKSSIEDTDFTKETTAFSENSLLVQAGMQMLAKANQVSNNLLQLLQ